MIGDISDPFKSFVRYPVVERLKRHQIGRRFAFAGQPRDNKSL